MKSFTLSPLSGGLLLQIDGKDIAYLSEENCDHIGAILNLFI